MSTLGQPHEAYVVPNVPSGRPAAGTREAFAEAARDRHPATQHVVQYFAWAHLAEHLGAVSSAFGLLALNLLLLVPDGPELTVALRHLLEAKDAAVRAALDVTPVALVPASED